jgi:hypothetical protein
MGETAKKDVLSNAKRMLDPSEAEPTLRKMLDQAGFSFEHPDPAKAWKVFKAFVRTPVNCVHDGVLFQCGVYDWSGTELFTLDFVRQFVIESEDMFDRTEELHLTLTCPPQPDSASLRAKLWMANFESNRNHFFAAVESCTEFRRGLGHSGWTCRLQQHEV